MTKNKKELEETKQGKSLKKNNVKEKLEDIDLEEDFEEYDDEDDYEKVVSEKKKDKKVEKKKTVEKDGVATSHNRQLTIFKCISVLSLLVSVVTLIIVSVMLDKVSFIHSQFTSDASTEEQPEYDISLFTEVSGDDMLDILERDDDTTYFIAVGRSGCPFSQQFLPHMQRSVNEYDYTLYYLDTDKLEEDTATKITEKSEVFSDENSVFGATPIVYVIRNGKVEDVHAGYSEYDEYAKFLEDNDVKKK